MTHLLINSNRATYVSMHASTTKWIKLDPWLQFCTPLPTKLMHKYIVKRLGSVLLKLIFGV